MPANLTTAAVLIQFRADLVEGGFTEAAAESIAQIAAMETIKNEGLAVRA